MTISLVQAAPASGNLSWTNTARNLLIAIGRGPSTLSFSDGVNTWQQAVVQNNGSNGIVIWYAANCAAGARTLAHVGGGVSQFVYLEYSGLALASVLGPVNKATGSGNPYASGSATATSANALIIGAVSNETANSLTDIPTGGFTDQVSFNGNVFAAHRIISASGAYSYGGSYSSSTSWAAAVAVFLGASSGRRTLMGAGT